MASERHSLTHKQKTHRMSNDYMNMPGTTGVSGLPAIDTANHPSTEGLRPSGNYRQMTDGDTQESAYQHEIQVTTAGTAEELLGTHEQHVDRFMNDAEVAIKSHPRKAKDSLASMNLTDEKLWHLQSINRILKDLETNQDDGLDSNEARSRLERDGPNSLEAEKKTPLYIIFFLQYCNLIVFLLLVASIASLAFQEWVEGFAILVIITLNAFIATWQERSASNALDALAKMSSPQCSVLRDGKQCNVESSELVLGDIVLLATGDVVPADLRLIDSNDLKVNEMLLTGESEDVSKKYNAKVEGSKKLTADNMVFSSTTVAAGNGYGIVVETGMNTRVGSIAKLLQGDESKTSKNPIKAFFQKYQPKMTPLQRSLHQLGFVMGAIALSVCALVFIVGIIRNEPDPQEPSRPVWLTMIMVSVSLAVSAVPEGLPMVVTICLSSGTADMVKKNVLVRKLAAVETLGAASIICTDKTGTLTEGKMTALKMWNDFNVYNITGKGFVPEGDILKNGVSVIENIQVRATLLASVLCSNTTLHQEEEDGQVRWIPKGNSSEAPLVVAAAKAGIWEEYIADQYPRVAEIPFSSSRKMMITVNKTHEGKLGELTMPQGTNMVANVKGAPNYILKNCTQYVDSDGNIKELSEAQKDLVMQSVDDLSSQALRVLAVAIKPLESLPYPDSCDEIEEKFAKLSEPLILMGLMASIDPERDGVISAIATARNASIRTVMITGDYLKTAVAIARNIDLITIAQDAGEAATDCTALRPDGEYLMDVDIDEITSRTSVFARAKPEDKIEIVKSLQRQGKVAAMTGDGVNDAPALKEADIGVAMGITGTEVAKGASDMILTDDNFVSIVSAVEKGRVIYTNIQKFVVFLLSTNVGEILLIFTAIAAGMPMPLEPLQILILNLFTDGMPAVALSLEKGSPSIMDEAPRPKKQHIIHGRLWFYVLANALFISSSTMVAFCVGTYWQFGDVIMSDIIKGDYSDQHTNTTCNRFYGINEGFQITGDCSAQYPDGTNVFAADDAYCKVDFDCIKNGISRAQTMTFVTLTFTEVLRAYTVRSFTQIMFKGMFSNKWMQMAALASILLTIFITNTPVIMDSLFHFSYIPWWSWLFSIALALNSGFWGEVLKACVRGYDARQARQQIVVDGFDSVLLEIRQLRHHMEDLQAQVDKMHHHPHHRANELQV